MLRRPAWLLGNHWPSLFQKSDLLDQLLMEPDLELYTDGSSFTEDGQQWARYMVVTINKVIEAQALAVGNWAQKAELITLTRALELSQGNTVNIYTDSKYAFMVVHVHGAIWKERGLLTSWDKKSKHVKEIWKLLEAVNLLNQVAIIHHPGLKKDGSQTCQGKQTANKIARQVASGLPLLGALIPHLHLLKFKLHYTEWDEEWTYDCGLSKTDPNCTRKINTHGMIYSLKL